LLFFGNSEHGVDSKGRLAIAAKHRAGWDKEIDGEGWFAIPWPQGILRLYPEKAFMTLAQSEPSSLTPAEERAGLDTALFGFAERLEMDSNGRITLPKTQMQLTGIKDAVVVVGARDHLEVYDKDKWTATQEERFQLLPEMVRRLQEQEKRSVR